MAYELRQINGSDNVMTDTLSKLFQGDKAVASDVVYFVELSTPAIDLKEVMEINRSVQSWMTPYILYLIDNQFPEDHKKAKQIKFHMAK